MNITLETIAEMCHNANKAWCEMNGDFSQPTWADAPEWQKSSARMGVMLHVEDPNASPSASHESWMAQKKAEGWSYGEKKDPEARTHPCYVAFEELPPNQQAKDHIFRNMVHALRPFCIDAPIVTATITNLQAETITIASVAGTRFDIHPDGGLTIATAGGLTIATASDGDSTRFVK